MNKSAAIADLQSRFPRVPVANWSLDVNGNYRDWTAASPHPAVNFLPVCLGTTWLTKQVPNTTSPQDGVAVTFTTGDYVPGWHTLSYQWRVSDDGNVWTDIAGETAASYTPSGVTGKYIGRKVTSTNGTRFDYIETAVS